MKILLRSFLILISFIVFGSKSFAQQRVPNEEGNAKKRNEWLAKRKQDLSVNNTENARWEAYLYSQQKLMESYRTPSANWECLGPNNQGGRVISHAFDPNDIETLWVGSASGGLWKTNDGGATWNAMTDQIPNLAIGAVAIKPNDTNVMLIGTGEGYLLSPWFQYGIGVLRSTDGGNTWNTTNLTVVDSLQFGCLGFAWDPINTNNVYLATTFGIYRSSDAGVTWTQTLSGIGTSIVINKKTPSVVYASLQDYAGSVGGIYKSVNYGFTWNLLSNGTPPSADVGFTALSICDSFPNVIYAGISTPEADPNCGTMQGLYKTSNGGATWQSVPNGGIDFYCYPAPFNNICQGWYGNVLQVAPNDSNNIFIGGVYLYNTYDGGATWNYTDWAPAEDPAWMHPDHHSFGISPLNPNIMYSFNDGGVFKTTNAGGTWFKKPNGMVTTQFYSISSSGADKNRMMGGTQDNGVYFNTSTDVSQNWTEMVPGDGFTSIMDPVDPDVWYTSELFNGRLKTTDAGLTYDTIQSGIVDPTYFLISMVMDPNNNQVMYTGTDVNIYKTVNAGLSWTALSNKPYISSIAIDKMNSNLIYICNDPALTVSYIYRSINGGATWTYLGGPGNKIVDMETDPITSGTVYAVRGSYSSGQQVYRSTNSGTTWQNITGDLPAIPVNTITLDPFNTGHIYIGTDLGVYLSTNGGVNWNAFNDNLPLVVVQDMHYYRGDSTIRIGTHGRGVWKTKAAAAISVSSNEKPEILNGFNTFPNPSSTDVTIEYSLKQRTNVTVKIYNVNGQEIADLLNAQQPAGTYKVRWDRRNAAGQKVSPGVYYIRLTKDGTAYSMKQITN
jgi:photosystem II stability/assembly factor-like uncharacterized protein